ncbi:hypothetical protein TREES_T100009340 [Tupaia chinensis]|uniref:Uncharacterized protein n=1 Tax=Tupaia chinensis TaxID=246437 RepID=L9JJ61_TUPCH|nr:hypothetical protein TREES_T100009340 [Tupaia chinensis]
MPEPPAAWPSSGSKRPTGGPSAGATVCTANSGSPFQSIVVRLSQRLLLERNLRGPWQESSAQTEQTENFPGMIRDIRPKMM